MKLKEKERALKTTKPAIPQNTRDVKPQQGPVKRRMVPLNEIDAATVIQKAWRRHIV